MVLEEISMIKNELLAGYTREAEEAEEAAAPAVPATTAVPAALSAATGPALTAETVRYAPPEAAASSATAASAAVAAAMAQAEQLQWRTAAYPTHVGACGGLGGGSGGGGGGGGDDVVWGEIVTGEPVGGAMSGAMGGARLPSALPHVAPPQQLCLPVPPLVPSSVPAHLPQGYLPSFAPVPSGPAPPPLLAQPQSQPHGSAGMKLPSYAAAGGYSGGGGSGGGGACGLDFSMPPPGGYGGGYGGGSGGGGAYLTAPPSQLPGAGASALPPDLAQLNLMSMGCGSSLQPAAPPPRAPPPTQGYEMRTAGLDLSMPGLCAPCAADGDTIAPGVPATILALERHAPAPTPTAYPTVLPPAAQPLTAPVGAGGLRALLIPRSTARVFLQLAADNTARNIETCAILVGKLLPSGLCVDRLLVPCQTGTANTCHTTDENEIYECRPEDRTHRAAASAA